MKTYYVYEVVGNQKFLVSSHMLKSQAKRAEVRYKKERAKLFHGARVTTFVSTEVRHVQVYGN